MRKRFYIGVGVVAILATVFTPAITQRLILLRDFHPSVLLAFRDTVRTAVGDSVAALSIDGFSLFVNASNEIAQKTYADTTSLKLATADSLGSFVNLRQLSSSNTNSGGMFVYSDSAYPEGLIAYGSVTAGKQWVDQYYLTTGKIRLTSGGAIADDATGDRTAIQKVLTLASRHDEVIIPSGKYLVDSTLVLSKPLRLTFEPNAWFILNDSVRTDSGYTMFKVTSDSVEIEGGSFKGTLQLSKDATLNYGNRKHREYGIELAMSGKTFSHIQIRNCYFEKWGHYAVRHVDNASTNGSGVTIKDCTFRRNFSALYLSGYGTKDVTLDNLKIYRTTYPHTSQVGNSLYGGNAIFTENSIKNLAVNNVVTDDSIGRMALEIWYSSNDSVPLGTGIKITNCTLGQSLYRTVSVGGKNVVFDNNTVTDTTDFLEFYGEGIKLTNNTFYEATLRTQGNTGDLRQWQGWVVDNNTWYSSTAQEPIYIEQAQNWKFTNNTISYLADRLTSQSRFMYMLNSTIRNNTFEVKANRTNSNVAYFLLPINCNISNNIVTVDSGLTYNKTAFNFEHPYNCEIRENKVNSYSTNLSLSVAPAILATVTDTLQIYTSNGSAWSLLARAEGFRTAPQAGDSVNDNWYLVRDSVVVTPSGAFVGRGGKLARYNSGWEFYAVDDYVVDPTITYSGQIRGFGKVMPEGANGDTIVVVNRGVVGNTIIDNNWDVNKNLKLTSNNVDLNLSSTSSRGVFHNNTFRGLGIVPGTVGIFTSGFLPLHARNYDSHFYYTRGQIIFYTMPVSGGKIGKVCTVSGKPGTWQEFGVID